MFEGILAKVGLVAGGILLIGGLSWWALYERDGRIEAELETKIARAQLEEAKARVEQNRKEIDEVNNALRETRKRTAAELDRLRKQAAAFSVQGGGAAFMRELDGWRLRLNREGGPD